MDHALGQVKQIAITVAEVEASLTFYRDVLGLTVLFNAGPNLAFITDGKLRIMLSTPQGAGSVGVNSILYFEVTDIDTTFNAIVTRGALSERVPQLAAKMPDQDLWIGFIRDPDGNLIGLMEEKPSA